MGSIESTDSIANLLENTFLEGSSFKASFMLNPETLNSGALNLRLNLEFDNSTPRKGEWLLALVSKELQKTSYFVNVQKRNSEQIKQLEKEKNDLLKEINRLQAYEIHYKLEHDLRHGLDSIAVIQPPEQPKEPSNSHLRSFWGEK